MELSKSNQTDATKQTDQPEKPKLAPQQAKPKAEVLNVQDSIQGPCLTEFKKKNKVGNLINYDEYRSFISEFKAFIKKKE